MRYRLTEHSDGNDRLILIFAGWSTEPEFYADLKKPGWDTMVCYDYSDFEFDEDVLSSYRTIYMYAWSLGVFASICALRTVQPTYAVAINGTEMPVSDEYGISEAVYMGTMDGLSERNLFKFRRRMYADSASYNADEHKFGEPDIDSLKYQLKSVADAQKSSTVKRNFVWNRIYVSKYDRIFPFENQQRAWHTERGVLIRDSSHRPNFEEILNSTIIDSAKVGRKFSSRMDTYDAYATVQRSIACKLTSLVGEVKSDVTIHILEIGSGTGLFTRMYGPILHPETADFMDLCSVPVYGIAPRERYFQGDAEEMITNADKSHYDMILSASAIQWFTNLPEFFRNCSECLKPGGMFVASSFLPGNLCEFDELRPSPLHYLSEDELRAALSCCFETVLISGDEERTFFPSAIDALRHLSMTGVGSVGGSSAQSVRELKKYIPRTESGEYYLTYRPVYIIASDPIK